MSATSTPPSRKAPAASSDKRTPAPNRSPSRLAQTPSTMSNSAPAINRTRSVRNGAGTPTSARAAARKPATTTNEADNDAKAELQARLDEMQERVHRAELASEESRKHADVLQIKLDEAMKEQGMLEESVHEHSERIEVMEVERRENLRAKRELEQIYEAEKVQSMREREEAALEKEEMTLNLQRLKETLTQKELRERTGIEDERRPSISRASSLRSEDASPQEHRLGRHFAPSGGLQRSDSRSNSRTVLQKDKVIEQLRLELADAQIKIVELEHRGGGTLHQLEKDLYDVKMQNARLMEENDSFQLLLQEKTLNGDLGQLELLRPPSHTDSHSRPTSSARHKPRASLADELENVEDESEILMSEDATDHSRTLQAEVNSLKDQNKALTLYINNIISRLLQHEQFEAILDKSPDLMAGPGAASTRYAAQAAEGNTEKDLPPPPPPPHKSASDDGLQPQGFLQRAGSVLRRKPARPASQFQPADTPSRPSVEQSQDSTVHQDPLTAPSIPFTRSSHRRSRSEWPAASVVTNMYKGPSSAAAGPLSPGLASRGSYFGQRIPSTGAVIPPTPISPDQDKENQGQQPPLPHRDSKVSSLGASPERIGRRSSNRNSFISNPVDHTDFAPSAESSNAPSPPHSTNSSGDRDGRQNGAIMMGSKPRPLRLVQEADEEKARKQANRASWFGGWGAGSFLPGRGNSNEGHPQQPLSPLPPPQ